MSGAALEPKATERPLGLAIFMLAIAVAGHVGWLLMLSGDAWRIGFGGAWRTDAAWLVGFGLVACQLAVLLVVRRRCWQSWREDATLLPGTGPALAATGVFMVATATAIPSSPAALPVHLALTTVVLGAAWLSLIAAAAFARPLGLDSAIDRLLESHRLLPWTAAGVIVATSSIWWIVFDGIPHIPDEVAYLLQARYMSDGALYVTGIPAGALDGVSTMTFEGRWFGIFPVGWPAILAVGVALGIPWLVNPILSAFALWVAHDLVRRVYDRRTANLAVLLIGTSPWFLFLGGSLMAHTASIVAGALALRGALGVTDHRHGFRWALAGGAALGVLVLIRPFEGVLVGLVAGGTVLGALGRRSVAAGPVAYAAVALAVGALTLPYNRAVTGSALLDPITLYFDRVYYPGANRLGFGGTVGNIGWGNDPLPGHSPFEALINASWNASLVQVELFGWAFGSLLVVALWLFHRGRVWRGTHPLMPSVVLVVLMGYTLYWYSAADFGPRYWSQMIVPLAALTAHAAYTLPRPPHLKTIVLLASLVGMPAVVVVRAVTKYNDYRGMTRDLEVLAREEGFGDELVLIRGDVFSDYSPGLLLNPPHLQGRGPLYFRYVDGAQLQELTARFPDRRVRIVDGPSLTGGAPRMVESGPIDTR